MVAALKNILPILALLLAMALWGSSFVAMKYSFRELHPIVVLFGRMAVATLCFLPFIGSYRRMPLTRSHVPILVLMCLCEPCLYFVFEAAALMYTSASQASMISTMLPLLVALGAGLFLGERLSAKLLAGFALAAAGALWLGYAAGSTEEAPNPLLGNLLEFIAMLCAAGYTISMKYLTRDLSSFHLTGLQAIAGLLFFAPMLALPQVRQMPPPSMMSLLVILYLGIVVSFGAYALYNYGVSRIPVSRASAFINLIPVFSIVLAFVLLDERLNLQQGFACAAVLAGVLLTQCSGATRTRPITTSKRQP
ncbi:MAG: DMT family transporter [Desulfobulbaceae bacterium]|nr:DMT family transporter [Desulfobulbaceae bacterium]